MFAGSDGPRVREGVVPVQQLNECQKKLSFSSWFDCWKTRRKGVQPCDSLREMGKEGGEDGHYQQVSAKHPGSIGSILFQSPWPFQLETTNTQCSQNTALSMAGTGSLQLPRSQMFTPVGLRYQVFWRSMIF